MLFDIKLDNSSKYVCDIAIWPKPCCKVKVESQDMVKIGHMVSSTTSDAKIDIIAMVEPERKIVTEFQIICNPINDLHDEFAWKIIKKADMVEYYRLIEEQGGHGFKEFIASTEQQLHFKRMEDKSNLVGITEDFLEERDVRIPTSDKEMIEAGEDLNSNTARIFGSDFDALGNAYEKYNGTSYDNIKKDRLDYLLDWAKEYDVDELDFYMEIADSGVTINDLENAWGKEAAMHAMEFMNGHGLEIAYEFH